DLRELHLTGAAVTDAGIKELAALRKLRTLELRDTQVTDTGVKDLHTVLPPTRITQSTNPTSAAGDEPILPKAVNRGWLAAAGICLLAIALSFLGVWRYVRQDRSNGVVRQHKDGGP